MRDPEPKARRHRYNAYHRTALQRCKHPRARMYSRYITRISQRDEAGEWGRERVLFFKRQAKTFRSDGTIFVDGTLTVVDERVKVNKRRLAIVGSLFLPRASSFMPLPATRATTTTATMTMMIHESRLCRLDSARRVVRLLPHDTALYTGRAAASVDISRREETDDYPMPSCSDSDAPKWLVTTRGREPCLRGPGLREHPR